MCIQIQQWCDLYYPQEIDLEGVALLDTLKRSELWVIMIVKWHWYNTTVKPYRYFTVRHAIRDRVIQQILGLFSKTDIRKKTCSCIALYLFTSLLAQLKAFVAFVFIIHI